jgi:tight adherence protein C
MPPTTLQYGRKYQTGLNWITATAMTGFHVGAAAAFFFIDAGAMLTALILYVVAGMLGIGTFVFGLVTGSAAFGLVGALALGGLGFFLPEFWLGRRIKKRQYQVLRATPDTLDLLTISVRAGLSFDGALAKVVEKVPGPLSDEFRRALAEVRVGKVRREALRDIVGRTEVPALTNFIGAIVQAEQLGVPIAKVLQVQSEQLRIERRQRAEEMAAKAPIKMLFPLVGCIFPSLFIVILGPAIILIMVNLGGGAVN